MGHGGVWDDTRARVAVCADVLVTCFAGVYVCVFVCMCMCVSTRLATRLPTGRREKGMWKRIGRCRDSEQSDELGMDPLHLFLPSPQQPFPVNVMQLHFFSVQNTSKTAQLLICLAGAAPATEHLQLATTPFMCSNLL